MPKERLLLGAHVVKRTTLENVSTSPLVISVLHLGESDLGTESVWAVVWCLVLDRIDFFPLN